MYRLLRPAGPRFASPPLAPSIPSDTSPPWESISMDHIEGLPMSQGTTRSSHVCRLTKMALFIATRATDTSEDLAQLYLRHVSLNMARLPTSFPDAARHSCPLLVIALPSSPHQRNLSTAYHPETDRSDGALKSNPGAILGGSISTMTKTIGMTFLPLAEFAYTTPPLCHEPHTPSSQIKVITSSGIPRLSSLWCRSAIGPESGSVNGSSRANSRSPASV